MDGKLCIVISRISTSCKCGAEEKPAQDILPKWPNYFKDSLARRYLYRYLVYLLTRYQEDPSPPFSLSSIRTPDPTAMESIFLTFESPMCKK